MLDEQLDPQDYRKVKTHYDILIEDLEKRQREIKIS